MGRGTNDIVINAQGAVIRGRQTATVLSAKDMVAADAQSYENATVQLADGTTLLLEEGDAGATMQGLAGIQSVAQHGLDANLVRVSFHDGTQALVNLENMSIGFVPEDANQEQYQGALVAALGLQAYNADASGQTAEQQAFGDLFETFRRAAAAAAPGEFNEDELAELYSKFAQLGSAALEDVDGITIDNGLAAQLEVSREQAAVLHARARNRAYKENIRKRISAAASSVGTDSAFAQAFRMERPTPTLAEMNAQLASVGLEPQPDDLEEFQEGKGGYLVSFTKGEARYRLRASQILGQPIPDIRIKLDDELDENGDPTGNQVSLGDFHVGQAEYVFFDMLQNMHSINRRAAAFEGLPGTGKDELAREFAALMYLPLVRINLGPKTSVEDLLGGETLQPKTYTTADGKQRAVTESAQHLGELGQALQYPSIIVIQEPEGKQDEFVRLHSILGDNVGTTDGRVFTVNSPSGDMTHQVHPDSYVIFTYNGNKSSVRFKQAFYDRVFHLSFAYPEAEDEAARYAKMADLVLAKNPDMPKALQIPTTSKDVMPVIKLMERARNAALDDGTDVLDLPGGRQGVMIYQDLMWAGWNIEGYDNMPDNIKQATVAAKTKEAIQGSLSYIYPHKRIDGEERKALIDTMFLNDLNTELEQIVKRGAETRTK